MNIINDIKSRISKKFLDFNRIYSETIESKFFARRIILEDRILNSDKSGVTDQLYCEHEIIVSLTSYGKRINDVCFTIESLMQQTRKANRIILWLDESVDTTSLPASLQLQKSRGLEIYTFEENIRSYKKLIPALKTFPEAAIITADDDIIYDFDILDRMISSYLADPKSVHACRVHSMTFDECGNLKPYSQWNWRTADAMHPARNFITGVGGALYPPRCLAPQVLDQDVFTSICPTADDVWFTAMALLNGTQIKKVATRSPLGEDFIENLSVQDVGLRNINVGENGQNDRQIQAVFSKYDIYKFIK